MNSLLFQAISFVALAATIIPCVLYFAEILELNTVKSLALLGTIGWFIATPVWMGRSP